jgi:hypothetical protein
MNWGKVLDLFFVLGLGLIWWFLVWYLMRG